jgi:solute carrier family 8 (sodium/calcium exchanger)
MFGFKLSNITPEGAVLSKKDFKLVHIVTDQEAVKKQALLAQLLRKITEEDETSYYTQFCNACMLHPTKNEEGMVEDVSYFDAVFHMICIGWKIFFAFIPPPHWIGGWACFVGCLCLIGIVTAVVGEFSNLFGCVLGIKPSITAITFVALGTSLPDTFASMAAAKQDKYADAAVGNVTGSNSVNVFLGLGLPWVIAVWSQASFIVSKGPGGWSSGKQDKFSFRFPDANGGEPLDQDLSLPDYYVPAGSLGFSVVVFITCAVICVITLVLRRACVGGELGGTESGRLVSCIFLCSLWGIYLVMSILQAYKLAGLENVKIGAVDEQDLPLSI